MKNDGAKANYFANTLAKLKHKKWELYVVSRVIHLLNDMETEFVCQQLILLKGGDWVFADMYFPQFNLCLEINERGGHSKLSDRLHDERRQLEILKAVGAQVEKIENFTNTQGVIDDASLDRINIQIDAFVELLRKKKKEAQKENRFVPWDINDQYSPTKHIEKSYLHADENASFRTITDVLRCFGYAKGSYQRAAWRASTWQKSVVWMPSFVAHEQWENKLLDDEETIVEMLKDNSLLQKHQGEPQYPIRYTFAKTRNMFGETLYRFLGEFEFQSELYKNDSLRKTYKLRRRRIDIPNPEFKSTNELD